MDIDVYPSGGVRTRRPGDFQGLRAHFVGIGGCGMYGAANILLESGAIVSGSDQCPFEGIGSLVSAGANVFLRHDAGQLGADVQLVVRSAAVGEDNPEVAAARARGIPIITYAELLGEITTVRRGVSIAGTHGKSTTTGLAAHLLRVGGLDPCFIIGAGCAQLGGSSGAGSGEHFVVESCEYARSFLHMSPHSAAILNIEAEHLDCYRDLEDIADAFAAFAGRVSPDGLLVVNHDDPLARAAARDAACRLETFGLAPGADWRAVSPRSCRGRFDFLLFYRDQLLTRCSLRLPGRYNVGNALAAAALAWEAGVSSARIATGLASFEGVHRRAMLRGQGRGVTIIDDYAHHPTEIRVTLRALRSHYVPKRTWVVFQPHQASRTRHLLEDFGRAFEGADVVLVPDIYSVRDTEEDRREMRSPRLVDRIQASGTESRYLPTFDDVTRHLEQNLAKGDLVITMGAGDVWRVADGLARMVC